MDEALLPPKLAPESGANEPARPAVWGFWVTAGLGFVMVAAYLLVVVAVAVAYVAVQAIRHGKPPSGEQVAVSGTLVMVAALFSAPVMIGLSILFAWLRKGLTVREYLGMRWPGWRAFVVWTAALVSFCLASDSLSLLLGKPIAPDVMVKFYQNAGFLPLFWFAIVIAGPVAEEFMFRGFMLPGLARTKAGAPLSAVLTAASWASMHWQYEFYGIATIFFGGLLLGLARVRTGSLWLCIFLHGLQNLYSTIAVAVVTARAAN